MPPPPLRLVAALAFLGLLCTAAPASLGATLVSLGPWTGGVTSHSAVVVVRLHEKRLPVLELSLTPDFRRPQSIAARPGSGLLPHEPVRFHLHGLRPATRYHFRIRAGTTVDTQRTGTFTTLPVEDAPASFTFAFGSCAETGSEHAVFAEIKFHQPLFFLHAGDMHYEDIAVDDVNAFRAAYERILGSTTQGDLYRHIPLVYMWDDHDFGPNDSHRHSPSRVAAHATYREFVPHHPLVADVAPELAHRTDGVRPLTQAFTVGRARFLVLDARTERDRNNEPDTEAKTMLGAWQKAWLKDELLASKGRHPLIFIVSTVPWTSTETWRSDNWAAYTTERAELADWMVDHGITGVCFLGGDAHMLAADDGTHNTYAHNGGPGFPALQAAPLDRRGSRKGGPWSVEPVLPEPGEGFFGVVDVVDHGDHVTVSFRGLNQNGEVKLRHTFEVPAPPPAS